MGLSKLEQAYRHITGIQRNYSDWPSTFGPCYNDECTNSARGCGLCANCHEKKLAEFVGDELAGKFHAAIKQRSLIVGQIRDLLEDR